MSMVGGRNGKGLGVGEGREPNSQFSHFTFIGLSLDISDLCGRQAGICQRARQWVPGATYPLLLFKVH